MNVTDFLKSARPKEFFRTLGRRAQIDEVKKIENQLLITLPSSYRELVEGVGFVRWFGNELFGVSGDEQNDTVARTYLQSDLHKKFANQLPPMPENGNIIAEIFGGGFCFLYSMESKRAGQISAHAPDEQYREVQYWDNLEDYFDYLIHDVKNWHSVEP